MPRASGPHLSKRLPWAVLLLVPATMGGCGGEDLRSELDRARSWTATSRLAADRRSVNAINVAVTSQLLDRAAKARSNAARSFSELATTDSERVVARELLDSLDEGISQLRKLAP